MRLAWEKVENKQIYDHKNMEFAWKKVEYKKYLTTKIWDWLGQN